MLNASFHPNLHPETFDVQVRAVRDSHVLHLAKDRTLPIFCTRDQLIALRNALNIHLLLPTRQEPSHD